MRKLIVVLLLAAFPVASHSQAQSQSAGASWKYSYADLQYGRHKFTFSVRANPAAEGAVNETFAIAGGSATAVTVDARSGKYLSRLLGGSKTLLEYLPYALAGGAPPASWPIPSDYPTYATPYIEWKYATRVAGWESVTVPAGTFRALRVELEGNRGKDPDPFWWPKQAARFQHTIWYAPEAKRYLKARHQAWSMTTALFADELVELLEVRAD